MKPRTTAEITSALKKKGFARDNNKKGHHEFYYLFVEGKKHSVYTYISHGSKEYSPHLMKQVSNQLHFPDNESAERFFDCPMTKEEYLK
ncbi:MAG: hypothetical protein Q8933_20175, partial [Bacteroidota bacterium]|nr:hypothetical protein [Bacteroidota bacterium]